VKRTFSEPGFKSTRPWQNPKARLFGYLPHGYNASTDSTYLIGTTGIGVMVAIGPGITAALLPAVLMRWCDRRSPHRRFTKHTSNWDKQLELTRALRSTLTELIDIDRLRSQHEIQLTVCATNARTARRRVFTDQEVSLEALLASACLPQLFRAVDIDGEPYWDGALTGNLPSVRCSPRGRTAI
jgi:predicted acylesterase/phospholipase RssA